MGCSQSKAVPEPPDARATAPAAPMHSSSSNATAGDMRRSSSERSLHSRKRDSRKTTTAPTTTASSPVVASSPLNGGSGTSASTTGAVIAPPPPIDDRWKALWRSLPHPIDPADVSYVVDNLMVQQINKFGPPEILFLQRRIRSLVKSLPRTPPTASRMGRFKKESSSLVESRLMVEKQHLLDAFLVRKFFPLPPPNVNQVSMRMGLTAEPPVDAVDMVESAILLLQHLQNWEGAMEIAVDSGRGMEMDVNKKKKSDSHQVPPPPVEGKYSCQESLASEGVTFSSVCFLIALALRGTRIQRLQLLFYLVLPPQVLEAFLRQSGGNPTWLLEVDNDIVLSLASMSHYYYTGDTFLPSGGSASGNHESTLKLSPLGVMEAIASLIVQVRKSNKPALQRANSNHRVKKDSDVSTSTDFSSGNSVVMEYLQEEGRHEVYGEAHDGYLTNFWMACEAQFPVAEEWDMQAFYEWAQQALTDDALEVLFHRLFASGNLPSFSSERSMVTKKWQQWQQSDIRWWSMEHPSDHDYLARSVRKFFQASPDSSVEAATSTRVWGGIGGYDGRGGLGHGIMYCVSKKWWDSWMAYVGWNWELEAGKRHSRERPGGISNQDLLDTSPDTVDGTLGSFHALKPNLVKGIDYVLVPPGVWNVLYELYAGGPPLPRMVLPPLMEPRERSFSTDSKQMEEEDFVAVDSGIEVFSSSNRLLKIPESFGVATHPWVLQVHVCDTQQPYRRGDAGPMTIRVMATPDQPLWRLYAEIIVRLPIPHANKAMDKEGRGQARLWRKLEPSGNTKDPSVRYGPWCLLCKNRTAILPLGDLDDDYEDLNADWRAYADHATVEGIGLVNGDRIMLEYAIQNKAGNLIWPREAAAKASRMRRLAEEENKFRRMLKGVDENDQVLDPQPDLVGTKIDAMDVSGRWFQVEILQVQGESPPEDEEEAEEEHGDETSADEASLVPPPTEHVQIRVDFTEFGGHSEWIDVDSDRLGTAGRFTRDKQEDDAAESNGKTVMEKTKTTTPSLKKATGEASENGDKICTLPGYGACGLANLGNTCYLNSALQCMSYMPLLRAYLLSAQYKATGDLNKDNPLGTGGKLLEDFAELLRFMWSGKYGQKSPSRFKSQLGKGCSQFSGADQQDAQEFLNYMLDVLHEDSNRVKIKPYVEGLEDDWVKENSLSRVGEEAWRRFLRRNRSVVADVAMGQVLNTVTCPKCHFSSRNFDPFNLLSIPFPTVADVVFLCTVVRRGTAANSPHILNRPRRGEKRSRFNRKKLRDPRAPSDQLVFEQYAIAMSRLADIGDLKLRLQNISGIPANMVKLCKQEEAVVRERDGDSSVVKKYMKVTALPDKEGPCVQLAKSMSSSEEGGTATSTPTHIVAFEMTLRLRPPPSQENGEGPHDDVENGRKAEEISTTDEEEDEEDDSTRKGIAPLSAEDQKLLHEHLDTYGDKFECRLYDTEPLIISKRISRSLWPKDESEFKLGLRVDAIDHRDHWFPGSVVEIIEGVASEHDEEKIDHGTKTKVRIHFDNFSTKWDETYTIDHFEKGQVRPLYSHATPRVKPTEFVVYHRHSDRINNTNALFGQTFYLQCENEWSTARAGAHILAQAARFVPRPQPSSHGPIDVDDVVDDSGTNMVQRIYDKAQSAISELIDLLVDSDRMYVKSAVGMSEDGKEQKEGNPDFDATALSTALVKKVGALLHKLPFEVRVCTAELPLGGGRTSSAGEDNPFPFSLMRTIGNYMNARNAVVLHWRDPPVDKKNNGRSFLNAPVMYVAPQVVVHKSIAELQKENEKAHASKNNPGSGGMHLSVCLKEFCKAQKLDLSDNWRCPRCREYREGKQHMDLWRLPDLLTFHIKRFNCSARWREKITTKVNFPLTGLDMSEWCHADSPSTDSNVYDLVGVMNHFGGMTGGHYMAVCNVTACSPDGNEEVAYSFPGAGINMSTASDGTDDKTGWRGLGGIRKEKEMNQTKVAAVASAKYASESSEPLWLNFDDDMVEPVPPRSVVSETAYVLFYRRRRLTPANIAKYSTLE